MFEELPKLVNNPAGSTSRFDKQGSADFRSMSESRPGQPESCGQSQSGKSPTRYGAKGFITMHHSWRVRMQV